MPTRLTRTATAAAFAMIATALILAACNDGGGKIDVSGVSCIVDPSTVPELEDGILNVGSDLAFEPLNFIDVETGTEDGLDIDLAKALADELCVVVVFADTEFERLIPAVNAGDFDVIMSAMTITEERRDAIDFIPYAEFGNAIIVRAGNPTEARRLDDLCGLAVAVQVGTIQVGLLNDQSDKCAIEFERLETVSLVAARVIEAETDAGLADFGVASAAAEASQGTLEALGPFASNVGILVRSGNPESIRGLEDLCSLSVAVQDDFTVAVLLESECAVDILEFASYPEAITDLTTAGSNASLTDFPAAFVAVADSNGRLELLDEQFDICPYGIGVREESTALKLVLEKALMRLMDSNQANNYQEIFDSWGLGFAALETATATPSLSPTLDARSTTAPTPTPTSGSCAASTTG